MQMLGDFMYLAIDWGEKRIGLATGSRIPKPYGVIENQSLEQSVHKILEIVEQEKLTGVVLGYPEREEESESQKSVLKLKSALEKEGLDVFLQSEEYTSEEAEIYLEEKGLSFMESKKEVDQVAAAIILERFLKRNDSKKKQ